MKYGSNIHSIHAHEKNLNHFLSYPIIRIYVVKYHTNHNSYNINIGHYTNDFSILYEHVAMELNNSVYLYLSDNSFSKVGMSVLSS